MTIREKLNWLIEHDGDCHESPWECIDCPLDDQCGFGMSDELIVEQAKILITKEAQR